MKLYKASTEKEADETMTETKSCEICKIKMENSEFKMYTHKKDTHGADEYEMVEYNKCGVVTKDQTSWLTFHECLQINQVPTENGIIHIAAPKNLIEESYSAQKKKDEEVEQIELDLQLDLTPLNITAKNLNTLIETSFEGQDSSNMNSKCPPLAVKQNNDKKPLTTVK